MKNSLRFPGAVLLSALFVSAAAQAAVFDVSTFDDLTNAVATSAAEDTIRLADNVYELPVTLSIAKAITLRGNDANPEAVVLRRVGTGNNRRVIVLSAAATLSGLVVENGYSNGNAGSAAGITASAGTITNCVIRNNKHHSNTYDTAGGVRLGSASCLLVDCVVTNNASTTYYHSGGGVYVGNYAATIRRCVIADNWAAGEGGGIFCSGSSKSPVIEDCHIARNVSGTNYWQYSDGRGSMSAGGGAYGGTLRRCTLASNWIGRAQMTFSGGGGAYGSTLYDCLVIGNHATAAATHYAGGLMSCTAYNCTITGNRASVMGGGARDSALRNCIVWDNVVTQAADNANHYGTSSAQYTCSTPLLTGTGNIALDPRLAPDGRIGGVSPCLDAGSDALVSAPSTTDLGGAARIQGGSVDMGCYEFDPASASATFDVGFALAADAGDAPFAAQFTARCVGAAPDATVTYRWDFDNDGTVDLETTDASAPHTYTEAGLYSVTVSATDGSASAAYTLPACVLVRSQDIYVARDGSDANDGFTPATPKATIPAAILAVASGGTVHLADGTYPLPATLTLETAVTVRGNDADPSAVVLRRSGSGAYNVVTMRNAAATLSGLVVENGYIEGSGAAGITASAGTVTNCVIRNNTRSSNTYGTGGGIHFSGADCTLVDCVVSNNATKTYHQAGGGIYIADVAAKIIRCRFIGNQSACQGGAIHCASASRKPVIEDCLIADNVSGTNYYANSSNRQGTFAGGGGAYGGTLRRCVLSGNWLCARSSTFSGGGAAQSSALYDCLVVSNAATAASTDYAGGLMSCTAYNCTIADNRASSLGGGARACTLRNCIVWGNTVADGSENGNHYATSSAQYTCTTPALTGDGNITLDPRLSPDWRIGGVSPCVDTASSALVTASTSLTDLDGNERIVGNAVDMGCYEFDPASAPVAFDVGFSLAADAGDAPFEAEFTASVLGAAPGAALTYRWDFDGDGTTDLTTAAAVVTNTYVSAGRYTVSLTATDGVSTGTYSLPACVLVRAKDVYVATDGSDDNDGLTPAAPKATIPEGVVCAAAGGTVHLADGTYPLPATVVLDTAVTLRGNDARPEAVILRRSGASAYNVVTLRNASAVLSGLVVENGYATGGIGAGGVVASGGMITNCVIRGNKLNNNNYETGGGVSLSGATCVLADCVISNNQSTAYDRSGAGVFIWDVAAKILRCTFTDNRAAGKGGGVYCHNGTKKPVFEDCVITCNVSATNYNNVVNGSCGGGGGVYGGTLRRCVIAHNRIFRHDYGYNGGGGALSSTLYSCLVAGNEATAASTDYAGGLMSCTAYNCTVVGNRACVSGGVHDGATRNSIVWGNVATSGNGTDNYGGSPTFAYTCTAPAASGAGNISADPGLRPATAPKPYTLRGGSPCLDVGDNTLANGDTDLAGNPRVFRNVIDLGCYENCDPHGTKLFLR